MRRRGFTLGRLQKEECMTRTENARSSASGVAARDPGRKAALCVLLAIAISESRIAYGQNIDRAPQGAEDAPQVLSRIVQPGDESRLTQLRGNTHPQARPEFDRGAVDQ